MDFGDCRSRQIVFIPHCALNQNARLARCAERPAGVTELVTGLLERGIGIVQLPCPELMILGLDRGHIQIRSGMESIPVRQELRRMAREVVFQIRQYQANHVRVLGILGKNGSPSCGAEITSLRGAPVPGKGVFVEELVAELKAQGVSAPLAGMVDSEPARALAVVDNWIKSAV